MNIYDEMRNDIEVLYGRGECEYNVYSDMVDYIDEAGTDYESLKNENDSLRKERDHWHVEQVHAYGNWEDTYKRASELEEKNARLRDIVRRYVEYTSQDRCEGCVCKRACNEGMVEECWQLTEIRKAEKEARELGIEI